ncbi:MAG: HAD-IA family hydrolase [Pseudomonadota bacterium]
MEQYTTGVKADHSTPLFAFNSFIPKLGLIMFPKAFLIGSIGVVAETSDIQRRAYNQALKEAGLSWHWDAERYRILLQQNGGRDRLRRLSFEKDAGLAEEDVLKIHARKTDIACEEIISKGVPLRPGVTDLFNLAKNRGSKLAFVTTTYRQNIDAISEGSHPSFNLDKFEVIMTTDDVDQTKPHPEVYQKALAALDLSVDDCLAIEDSKTSLQSAKQAGIKTIVTPGRFTEQQDFSLADGRFRTLSDWYAEFSKTFADEVGTV